MSAEETTERTDLSDLVRNRMGELGLGLRTLADLTVDPEDPDAGPLYKRGTLDNLTKGHGVKAPTEGQLRALAAALQLPPVALQRAASAQFFGLISERWSERGALRLLVARAEELNEEELSELDELAQIVMRRRGRKADR